ncbi:MAG: IPT/TIG domain-containing protein, partial [Candidatus Firestonebacteria bacterium]|nr:IPT/TIG domain-containing protein [Candidatus Firestonebacteria bacterium]
MKNKINQLLLLPPLMFLLSLLPSYSAETWSGPNGGAKNINSSPTVVGSTLELKWTKVLDPQSYGVGAGTGLTGCIRSKNLVFRNGEFVLITPNSANAAASDMSIFDAATGNLKRSFVTVLDSTTRGDRNTSGTEGRDLNMGLFNVNWNQNGNVYFRSPGDFSQTAIYRASDGQKMTNVGPSGFNQSAFIFMNDNCNFGIISAGGHYPYAGNPMSSSHVFSLDGLVSDRAFSNTSPPWSPTYLIDNGWVYVIHYNTAIPSILATPIVIGYQFGGNTSTASDIALTSRWTWTKTDARLNYDIEGTNALKPWCLGTNNIYYATMTSTSTTANAFSGLPVTLSAIDRTTGSTVFTIDTGVTTLGVGNSKYFAQIACLNTGGTDYVATMLPELYNSATSKTKISMVNVNGTTPSTIWNYTYNNGDATPIPDTAYANINTSTKMVLAGDAIFVAYVKTTTPLTVPNLSPALPYGVCYYLDARNEYPLNLYIDRFDLSTGTKTSTNFSMGVKANTLQLDDFTAVDGKLYALVTYRENGSGVISSNTRGAQLVAMVGSYTGGNSAPVFTALPGVSTTSLTLPTNTVTLTAVATDSSPVSMYWSKASGFGDVSFSENGTTTATNITATFNRNGTYIICALASDGERTVSGNVTVNVNPSMVTVTLTGTDTTATEGAVPDIARITATRAGGGTGSSLTVYISSSYITGSGDDFVSSAGSFVTNIAGTTMTIYPLVIPAGSATGVLTITPNNDSFLEPTERIRFSQVYDIGYTSAGGSIDVYIYDDDLPSVTFTALDTVMAEPADTGTVRLSAYPTPSSNLTLDMTFSGAVGGSDYISLPGPFYIASGTNTLTLTITPIDDSMYEGTEILTIKLNTNANYSESGTVSLTITDDDTNRPPVLSLTLSSAVGTAPLTVTFNASASVDPDNNINTYFCSLNTAHPNPPMISSNTESILSYVYNSAGVYPFEFQIGDTGGEWVVTTGTVTVTSAAAVPVISGISPTYTALNTATKVTLDVTGTGFYGGTAASTVSELLIVNSGAQGYDYVNGSNLTVTGDTTLRIRLDQWCFDIPGVYDVRVAARGGMSATTGTTKFTVGTIAPVPVVSGISPGTGLSTAANTVTITGSGFYGGTGATAVTTVFLESGSSSIELSGYNVASDTQITGAGIPTNQPGGVYDVRVRAMGGTSPVSSTKFTITTVVPDISSYNPSSGSNLTAVTLTINGSKFFAGGSSSAVTSIVLNDPATTAITLLGATISDTVIAGAVIPPGVVAGSYNIRVTSTLGTSLTNSVKFGVTTPVPTVSSFTPAGTLDNTAVRTLTITGSNFFAGIPSSSVSQIRLSNVAGTTLTLPASSNISGTVITGAILPAGVRAGTYDLLVVTPGGTGTGSSLVTITTPAPTVTLLNPAFGSDTGGKTISIHGTGFFGGEQVSAVSAIKLTDASSTSITGYTVINNTLISGAIVPAGVAVSNTYNVIVTTSGGNSATSAATAFTIIAGPTVAGAAPSTASNLVATTITITGANFINQASVLSINLDDAAGTAITKPGAGITNTLIPAAVIPAGVSAGTYNIKVTTIAGNNSTSTGKFTVTANPPVVSFVTPSGSFDNFAARTITITGSGFFAGTATTAVNSVSVNGVSLTISGAVISDNAISGVILPSGIPAGSYDILVTTSGGTVTGSNLIVITEGGEYEVGVGKTFATITAAFTTASSGLTAKCGTTAFPSGQVIKIFPGTYTESITIPSTLVPTASRRLTITGVDANGTPLTSYAAATSTLTITNNGATSVFTSGVSNVTFSGLHIRGNNTSTAGIGISVISTALNNTVEYCSIFGEKYGIWARVGTTGNFNSRNCEVSTSFITDSTGIFVRESGLVENNFIHNVTNGIFLQYSAAASVITVRNNYIKDIRAASGATSVGININNFSGTAQIYNNLITRASNLQSGYPYSIMIGSAVAGAKHLIYNNTSVGHGLSSYGDYRLAVLSTSILTIKNNLLFPSSSVPGIYIDLTPTTYSINNNWVSNANLWGRIGSTNSTFASWQGLGNDASSSTIAPSLVNLTNLTTTSATANDAKLASDYTATPGADLSAIFTTDYFGTTRTAPWSAGFHEYVSTSVPIITGLNPSTGVNSTATSITVTGSSFTGVTAVTLDNTSLAYTLNGDGTLYANVPSGKTPAAYDLYITNPTGTSAATSASKFTVAGAPPTVSGVTPAVGFDNTASRLLTLSGTGFTAASTVTVNGVQLTMPA